MLDEGLVEWWAMMSSFAAAVAHPSNLLLACYFGTGDAHRVASGYGPLVKLFLHRGTGGDSVALGWRFERDEVYGAEKHGRPWIGSLLEGMSVLMLMLLLWLSKKNRSIG